MDQADGLRQLMRSDYGDVTHKKNEVITSNEKYTRVISVTSGKGGVGKTNIVANLAVSFRRLGKTVLILDGDLGLANIDILFKLNPTYNIQHVINGEKSISEVIVEGPEEIGIIPAGSGVQDLVHLTKGQKLNLLNEFDSMEKEYDIFLIDTSAGISSNVIYFNIAADERIVVATGEPTSITDAYALIKVMYTKYDVHSFKLLINIVRDEFEAKAVYENLSNAIVRFLKGISLEYIGFIPKDSNIEKAVKKQSTVIRKFPQCSASKSFMDIAKRILETKPCLSNDGNIKFFWKKLVNR